MKAQQRAKAYRKLAKTASQEEDTWGAAGWAVARELAHLNHNLAQLIRIAHADDYEEMDDSPALEPTP